LSLQVEKAFLEIPNKQITDPPNVILLYLLNFLIVEYFILILNYNKTSAEARELKVLAFLCAP
jgi:hypothetical protein